jgi:hypothetical protein
MTYLQIPTSINAMTADSIITAIHSLTLRNPIGAPTVREGLLRSLRALDYC